ncbi:unnamed protein product [Spirodela intermedia]|uniref:EF-hand domain-containing protein n=1 Tax=Spirodela intermedia TaxID=51605 RepID=A0A7I8IS38_SPIIN|nr:unnamed protein product [Spirodela intermedia]CAA6660664.1 unnamed protein product [Spirodela intermedia]
MEPFGRYSSQSYAPSAPPLPPEQQQSPSPSQQQKLERFLSSSSGLSYGELPRPSPAASSGAYYGYGAVPGAGGGSAVDRDGSGFIDEMELQSALSQGNQKFGLRTVRLLMFLFMDPRFPSKIGPTEFAAIWDCIGKWRATFERFDRDRSGEIDSRELRDALLSLGYAVPDSVIQVILSKYKSSSRQGGAALNFDSFVECGMIVKGLTESFKEKDPQCTGSAKLTYDAFMSMVVPFIVP